MTNDQANQVQAGTILTLKNQAAARYGLGVREVTFRSLHVKEGYRTPKLCCTFTGQLGEQRMGWFKPSDFERVIISRPMWLVKIQG